MHFIKCSNCGHFNEVKTEYLIFCSQCNKKLEKNYTDWSKRNSDKSFDDYKQLICTTETNETSKVKAKSSRPKGLKYWIAFAVTFGLFYVIGYYAVGFLVKPSFNKALMEIASEMNKSCPIMIDNATRLDNLIVLPDNVFQYNYTLVNMTKDSVKIDDLRNYLEPTIINFVKTNPDMKKMRDFKITVNYYYKDKTGVYLFTISVKPEQYE